MVATTALTCTPSNPTPPTNFSSTGTTAPNPPNYTKNTYNDSKNYSSAGTPTFPPPYFDDGVEAGSTLLEKPHSLNEPTTPQAIVVRHAFATNTAALASGSGATGGGTEGTYPGTGSGVTSVSTGGAVPASTSIAHEGGTVTLVTQTYATGVVNPSGPLVVSGIGPALAAPSVLGGPVSPNQTHPSSLSPATNPTLSSISPTTTTAGTGTVTVTATGVGFTRASVIYSNGVAYPTTFVSSTSLTAPVAKKATAGQYLVAVISGGVVTTVTKTLDFT